MSALTDADEKGAALVGPAGVGKTRLTDEVVARLEWSGLAVRRCYATVATSAIPFGAMAAMLPADMRTANPLGRAVEHLLSGQQPLGIVVDDAHVLDRRLHRVAASRDPARACTRTGDVASR